MVAKQSKNTRKLNKKQTLNKLREQAKKTRTINLLLITAIALLVNPFQAEAFCFEMAGAMYGISPQLLWSIAKVESSFNPKAINRNSNGTYDFGVMQINSSWAPKLGKTIWNKLGDPCTNVMVGAWILANCMHQYGNTWEAVGCYNAKSKDKKAKYAKKVYQVALKYTVNPVLTQQYAQYYATDSH